jgi:hypothetical protein
MRNERNRSELKHPVEKNANETLSDFAMSKKKFEKQLDRVSPHRLLRRRGAGWDQPKLEVPLTQELRKALERWPVVDPVDQVREKMLWIKEEEVPVEKRAFRMFEMQQPVVMDGLRAFHQKKGDQAVVLEEEALAPAPKRTTEVDLHQTEESLPRTAVGIAPLPDQAKRREEGMGMMKRHSRASLHSPKQADRMSGYQITAEYPTKMRISSPQGGDRAKVLTFPHLTEGESLQRVREEVVAQLLGTVSKTMGVMNLLRLLEKSQESLRSLMMMAMSLKEPDE